MSERHPLTVESAIIALQGMLTNRRECTLEAVVKTVADFYSLSPEEIKGRSRRQKVVKPRQIAMFLARQETKASLPKIGKALGNRDHTTVLYSLRKIGDQNRKEMRCCAAR